MGAPRYLTRDDNPPVSLQRKSSNRKLSPVKLVRVSSSKRPRPVPQGPYCASTYVSIHATCPDTCLYKYNGCYVDGMSGYTFVGRLDHRAKERGWGGWETIAAEADAIERTFQNKMPQDGWKGRGRDMRLHISGDTYNESSTWILGTAASNYMLRGGGRVWTYTHRWREVARDRWKLVSALASVESVDEFKEAERQGYAMAITLPYFPTEKAFQVPGRPDLRVVPCLAETRGLTCIECRLCFDDKKLREKGIVIGFSLHGTNSTVASQRLGERQGDLIGKVPLVLRGQRVRLKVVG